MTQKEFNNMPLLLKPGEVCNVLGCDRETLRELEVFVEGLVVHIQGMRHPRYNKLKVAEIAKIKID